MTRSAPKRTRPYRRHPKPDPITAPDLWMTKNAMAVWHALAPLDQIAREMELKWGVDRLPRLVSVETAAKFGQVSELLNTAIDACDLPAVQRRAQNAIRGWQAMDAEATKAGASGAPADCWAVRVGQSEAAAWIVKDPAAARAVSMIKDGARIYTLDEIGRLIGAVEDGLVGGAKEVWPDAEIVDVRKRRHPL